MKLDGKMLVRLQATTVCSAKFKLQSRHDSGRKSQDAGRRTRDSPSAPQLRGRNAWNGSEPGLGSPGSTVDHPCPHTLRPYHRYLHPCLHELPDVPDRDQLDPFVSTRQTFHYWYDPGIHIAHQRARACRFSSRVSSITALFLALLHMCLDSTVQSVHACPMHGPLNR